jgi:hypothetical protein
MSCVVATCDVASCKGTRILTPRTVETEENTIASIDEHDYTNLIGCCPSNGLSIGEKLGAGLATLQYARRQNKALKLHTGQHTTKIFEASWRQHEQSFC